MIDGNVLVLLERNAIETVSQTKDTIDDLRQFEVGTKHLLVQVVFLHLQLMAIEASVPRIQLLNILLGHFDQLCLFLQSRRLISLNEVVEQPIDITGLGGHTTLQHVVCISLVTQQLGYLTTQIDESLADVEVVLAVVVRTLGITCHIHLLTQFALGRIRHERRVGGHVEGEHPALLLLFLGSQSSCLARRIRQSVEL